MFLPDSNITYITTGHGQHTETYLDSCSFKGAVSFFEYHFYKMSLPSDTDITKTGALRDHTCLCVRKPNAPFIQKYLLVNTCMLNHDLQQTMKKCV